MNKQHENLQSGVFKLKEALNNKAVTGLLITEAEVAAILLGIEAPQALDTGKISDGYHTFDELYEHRHLLFLNFLLSTDLIQVEARLDHYPDWDVICAILQNGEQISYHLPVRLRSLWENEFIIVRESKDIIYDGHTSQDVLDRLRRNLE